MEPAPDGTPAATPEQVVKSLAAIDSPAGYPPCVLRSSGEPVTLVIEVPGVNPTNQWELSVKAEQSQWSWALALRDRDGVRQRHECGGFLTEDGMQGMLRVWREHLEILASEKDLCGDSPEISRL